MTRDKTLAGLVLIILVFSVAVVQPARAAQSVSATIKPSEDAYVAADLNDNGTDRLGLKSLNTGSLPILKVWYAWNLTITNKTGGIVGYFPVKIVTVAYFKLDLSSLGGAQNVTSATLKLYSQNSNLTGASRFLVAYFVPTNTWSQSTMNWYNAPGFTAKQNSSMSVNSGQKGWYSLDLTKMVRDNAGKTLSVALTFLVLYKHNEEQVVFNSTRASGAQPYLAVTYVGNPPFSIGGMFDFSEGLNSTNGIGLLIIIAVIIIVVLALFWFRRRRGGTERRPKPKPGVPKEKGGGMKGAEGGGGMALGAKCPSCGEPVQSDFKLCPSCGTELTQKLCGNCGKSMKMAFKVCPYCGNKTG